MPSEGVFIAVGKLLGGLVRDGVRGRRSRKIGEPVALRIGQNKLRVNRSEGRIAVIGRIAVMHRIGSRRQGRIGAIRCDGLSLRC